MVQEYTRDHLMVIMVLGRELPKKPSLSTSEICLLGFRDRGEKADRVVRNAYRKLRERELIEIVDRGMYRLTALGASLARQLQQKKVEKRVEKKKIEKPKVRRSRTKKASAEEDLG